VASHSNVKLAAGRYPRLTMASRSDDVIPIFPLSTVVLFPKVQTPLYIFEPRYRQMTRHALGGDRRIGMSVVLPAHLGEMRGDPPLYPIGCTGVIAQHREEPDGSFHIALMGTRRFVIREEFEPNNDVLFRSARVEMLDDALPEADRVAISEMRAIVFDQLRQLVQRVPKAHAHAPDEAQFEGVDDETLVNALCQAIDFEASEKQGLLEAESIRERLQRLTALLRFRLASDVFSDPSGSRTLQ
jgi:Lon protease-like protein